jgi:transposase
MTRTDPTSDGGVEDVRAMTARLERDLMDAGQQVVRVPTQLMARTHSSACEHRKSDPIDALVVARAVLAHPQLARGPIQSIVS